MSYDLPLNKPCYLVNMDLWKHFHNVYKSVNDVRPSGDWTEEEVVQWLDTYRDEPVTDTCVSDEQAWIDYQESVADYYSSFDYGGYDDGA